MRSECAWVPICWSPQWKPSAAPDSGSSLEFVVLRVFPECWIRLGAWLAWAVSAPVDWRVEVGMVWWVSGEGVVMGDDVVGGGVVVVR